MSLDFTHLVAAQRSLRCSKPPHDAMDRPPNPRSARAGNRRRNPISLSLLGLAAALAPAVIADAQCARPTCVYPKYSTGSLPLLLSSNADLSGDGYPELIVANSGASTISVLLNNGDGSFGRDVTYEVGNSSVGTVGADLNVDGHMDVAVTNGGGGSGSTISVLLNQGDGTLATHVEYEVGFWPAGIVASDLDLDGDPDLAVANISSDSISVLINQGDGTFATQVVYRVGSGPHLISAADVNNDGYPDLATANAFSDNVSVLLNNRDGTFGSATQHAVGSYPVYIVAADLDGDGNVDLATANQLSDNVSLLFSTGGGAFAAQVLLPVVGGPAGLDVADIDLDGAPDLATAVYNSMEIAILLNEGDGTFPAELRFCVEHSAYGLAANDLDLDGFVDLAVTNFLSDDSVAVILDVLAKVGAGGNCFEVHPEPGCTDQACCNLVCAIDSSCCDTAWDDDCVSIAQRLCEGAVACPVSDHDCFSTGGPGCTDIACCTMVCAVDPFCCEVAWDGICVEGASSACSTNCPGNDFSPGGCVLEYLEEPCGTDTNGGCNSLPVGYMYIECGDDVCGDFWALDDTRDTDWFHFTIDQTAIVQWEVYADVPVTVLLVSAASCDSTILATGGDTCPTVASAELCPGAYWAFVAPAQFANLPCAEYYNAKLTCFPASNPPSIVPCCGNPQAGSCFSVHPTPYCDNLNCCEVVCTFEPPCCTTAWDALCVQRAAVLGNCVGETPFCPNDQQPNVYVCEVGCRDEFNTANGLEPASGQPGCVAFDVIPVDGCFRHTFTDCWPSCPAGCGPNACGTITGAFLEIRFQEVPFVGPPPEFVYDFVAFYDQASSAALGVTPIVGLNTVTLDLSNLPGSPFDILSTLCDGELTVAVVDDTAVDYMALTVIHCPCATPFRPLFEFDDAGDFTTPSPTNASQALQDAATCSSGALTSYDVEAVNQCFLETIDLAPYTCVLDGYLAICVVPTSTGFVNDSLALELIGPYECGPSAFAWGMSLANLEALGYVTPPLAQGQVSCIELFLDNLPPDARGVRDISSHLLDGSLDILIQDDTGVTSVFFGPSVCACEGGDGCPVDLTGDDQIDGADLGILLGNWGGDGEGDFNGDDVVDGADLGLLLGSWGSCP